MTCVLGRLVVNLMKIKNYKLITMTKKLTAANGKCMVIHGPMLLTLSLGYVPSNQMVYLMHQVDCLFLSQSACKELHIVSNEFPVQVAGAP